MPTLHLSVPMCIRSDGVPNNCIQAFLRLKASAPMPVHFKISVVSERAYAYSKRACTHQDASILVPRHGYTGLGHGYAYG
ncbi:hypothetical protein RJT34_16767 [Clitoria ternatea]|uniref:Uncharacterized protein n=1 Tax=Clitoria ternatea TaxID=43366 RepID=A0AAN9J7R9_CLITE